ncbi:hypothetical protein BAUCODRAFT_395682 [Baudoinia panamericana UAMH 10762]|uniref:Uncharacterized protein n=1 Tax=Baudoinia panamericana (strain UAMH 10762) TaxID=717646 RepID=M2LX09_BAUPA|nr:uncharacterized protein BAUCODRAFT_395682 [Baudoinia panamericana UAMH 10762]EMC99222.1 hypothetical protein BAUCODRAFT_395682 [Baudoinia panamericana UAMH 10762]
MMCRNVICKVGRSCMHPVGPYAMAINIRRSGNDRAAVKIKARVDGRTQCAGTKPRLTTPHRKVYQYLFPSLPILISSDSFWTFYVKLQPWTLPLPAFELQTPPCLDTSGLVVPFKLYYSSHRSPSCPLVMSLMAQADQRTASSSAPRLRPCPMPCLPVLQKALVSVNRELRLPFSFRSIFDSARKGRLFYSIRLDGLLKEHSLTHQECDLTHGKLADLRGDPTQDIGAWNACHLECFVCENATLDAVPLVKRPSRPR